MAKRNSRRRARTRWRASPLTALARRLDHRRDVAVVDLVHTFLRQPALQRGGSLSSVLRRPRFCAPPPQHRATIRITSLRYVTPVSRLAAIAQICASSPRVGIASLRACSSRAARFSAVGSAPLWISPIVTRASVRACAARGRATAPACRTPCAPSGRVGRKAFCKLGLWPGLSLGRRAPKAHVTIGEIQRGLHGRKRQARKRARTQCRL